MAAVGAQSRRSTEMLTSSLKSKPGYPGQIRVSAGSLQRDAVVLPARMSYPGRGNFPARSAVLDAKPEELSMKVTLDGMKR
jgi:hypothetical protein